MRCDGCSSLSLLAGMLVTPADPFVRPHGCTLRVTRVLLWGPCCRAGGCAQPPHMLPCLPPSQGVSPSPCTSLPIAVPSSVGRHDAVLPVQSKGGSP